MPKYGKPNNGLVADFVNATFSQNKTEEEIKQIVTRLDKKNVTIYKWPHEKGLF